MITAEYRRRIEALAVRLNAIIPDNIPIDAWSLPILEQMEEELAKIRERLTKLEERARG